LIELEESMATREMKPPSRLLKCLDSNLYLY